MAHYSKSDKLFATLINVFVFVSDIQLSQEAEVDLVERDPADQEGLKVAYRLGSIK